MQLTIVVGYPRSGTSLIANILNSDLFYSGDPEQMVYNEEINPEGIWENNFVSSLNDTLLNLFKADSISPDGIKKALAIDWQSKELKPQIDRYMAQAQLIINSLIRQMRYSDNDEILDKEHIYWKDPKTSILLPFWLRAINKGNYNKVFDEQIDKVNIIWCFRNIDEAVDSLISLDLKPTYTKDQYLEAWELYNSNIAQVIAEQKIPFFMVNYNDILKSPKKVVEGLFAFIDERAGKTRISTAVSKVNVELQKTKSKKKVNSKLYTRMVEICKSQIS
jgi:hypothetical protein